MKSNKQNSSLSSLSHEYGDTCTWEKILRILEESGESERQSWFLAETVNEQSPAA